MQLVGIKNSSAKAISRNRNLCWRTRQQRCYSHLDWKQRRYEFSRVHLCVVTSFAFAKDKHIFLSFVVTCALSCQITHMNDDVIIVFKWQMWIKLHSSRTLPRLIVDRLESRAPLPDNIDWWWYNCVNLHHEAHHTHFIRLTLIKVNNKGWEYTRVSHFEFEWWWSSQSYLLQLSAL